MCQFSGKTDNFNFFGPKLSKNWFWARNFKNVILDPESAPPRYHMCQFSVKMDNFEFFGLNLGKLPNYIWCFGSNNVQAVAKSCAEAEMSWVEVGRAGCKYPYKGKLQKKPNMKDSRIYIQFHLSLIFMLKNPGFLLLLFFRRVEIPYQQVTIFLPFIIFHEDIF